MRALFAMLFAGAASCTTTAPLQLLPSTIPVDPTVAIGSEVVEGRACAGSLFYVLSWGNSSVAAAKADALASANAKGLADVSVDVEKSFYVIYGETCTVVRGRRIFGRPRASDRHDSENADRTANSEEPEGTTRTRRPNTEPATSSGDEPSTSDLDDEVVVRGISRLSTRLAGCSEDDPSAKGHVVVSVRVRPSGEVRAVVVKASPGKALGECVDRILSHGKFDATQLGGRFNYTFDFP